MSSVNKSACSGSANAPNSPGVATTAILPVEVPNTSHRWARGIRAGRWVFATGQSGTDYVHALAPEVLQSGHPFDGPSKAHREAKRLFQNVAEVLSEGGSSASNVVRIDQYYTSPDVVDAYHQTRREFFSGKIPPSTSNLHRRFAARSSPWKFRSWRLFPMRISAFCTRALALTKSIRV